MNDAFEFLVLGVKQSGGLSTSREIPSAISWLAQRVLASFSWNAFGQLDAVIFLAKWANGLAKAQLERAEESAITIGNPDSGNLRVMALFGTEQQREGLIAKLRAEAMTVRPSTREEFVAGGLPPMAEFLYKSLMLMFSSEDSAKEFLASTIKFPFEISDLFFAHALVELEQAAASCNSGAWSQAAIEHYTEAVAAFAFTTSKFGWGVIADNWSSVSARNASESRWARLDSVKELAFRRRSEMPHLSRSAAISKMLPEILEAARNANEPLTGGTPKDTVTSWFRKAGIK